jgi:hypothetical protein
MLAAVDAFGKLAAAPYGKSGARVRLDLPRLERSVNSRGIPKNPRLHIWVNHYPVSAKAPAAGMDRFNPQPGRTYYAFLVDLRRA